MSRHLLILLALLGFSASTQAVEALSFDCKRTEKDYVEEYELKIMPASNSQKAKVFLDDRDLDQSDTNGHQIVKSVVLTPTVILMTIDATFDPEQLQGITYPAGSVMTQMSLNRATGQLKKVETIQGGILGASLGNGTHLSEELCVPSKAK